MIRYTDSTLILTIGGVDISEATDIHVTIKQRNDVIDITDVEITETGLIVHLDQEQTALFKMPPVVSSSTAAIQVNMFLDGRRVATNIAHVDIGANLLEVVINE